MSQGSGEAVVAAVYPRDAWRILGMFLYKALKHRDEEEFNQVHTLQLGVIGQHVRWGLFMLMFQHNADCINDI